MSGFLGSILGSSAGGTMEAALAGALPGIIMQMMSGSAAGGAAQAGASAGGAAGGIAGLIQQFEGAGLGQQVQSWVGSGHNMPVTPQQLGQVFPQQQVQQWSQQAGTTPDALMQVLAHVLPHAVDQATPNGQLPAGGQMPSMPDISGLLGRFLSR